jgi:hypothetical protein
VDPVGGHGLHDVHVVDEGLAARLARRLLIVLDDLVLAVRAGGLLFQHRAGQQRVLLQQGTRSRLILQSERLYLQQTWICGGHIVIIVYSSYVCNTPIVVEKILQLI